MTLDQLQEGQRARIDGFIGDDLVLQRLMEMGLLEDEEIEVVGLPRSAIRWRFVCAITA